LYKLKIADYIIAALIVFLSSVPVLSSVGGSKAAGKALVQKDNKIIKEIDLAHDGITDIGCMTIETRAGRIHILSSNCPHQLCTHSGWIDRPSQTLVCAPNRVIIEIKGTQKNDAAYDAVSY
jgi:hypothetical protein